jgi:plastocyanin domain-containing protein
MTLRILAAASAALALLAPPPARSGEQPGAPRAARASARPKAASRVQVVEVKVTKEGFEPAEVTVERGRPVRLVVTRTLDRTCATEIVMKDFGVNQPLPRDVPVEVTVTPKAPGSYRFACGMDMVAGVLKVL